MTSSQFSSSVLLEKVYKIVHHKLPADQALTAQQFMSILFGNMSHSDLLNRNDSDLYGVGIGLWNALNLSHESESHIRVYNPELSRHGWQSTHTILEIVVNDSPFLVDSMRMLLSRNAINCHLMLHQPIKVERNAQRHITKVAKASQSDEKLQTVFMVEIDRQSDEEALLKIRAEIELMLSEVDLVVNDWQPMLDELRTHTKTLSQYLGKQKSDQYQHSIAFLNWVGEHNFTLMGYRYYALKAVKGDYILSGAPESSLGLYKNIAAGQPVKLSTYTPSGRELALDDNPLILNKSNYLSRVHRPAYIDHVGIKDYNAKGQVIGEHRFIGLYASSIYNRSALEIPLIKQKLMQIMDSSGLKTGSHAFKALLNIMETYPRDELIQARANELLEIGLGVENIQERDLVRLFVRKDVYGRFYSCVVYTTKDRYNTALRIKTQEVLKQHFGSDEDVEFSTFFTEGNLARTHYIVKVGDPHQEYELTELEANLIEAARSWEDKLSDSLSSNFGEERGNELFNKYQDAFQRSYKEDVLPGSAVADITQLELLNSQNQLGMLFYRPQEENDNSNVVRLKLFHLSEPLHLSDILPILENTGLRVIGERPYRMITSDGSVYWILDFSMLYVGTSKLDIEKNRDNFQSTIAKVWNGALENDGFNKLVLGALASGREVALLRAYAKYMRQIGSNFSQTYIEETLVNYPQISQLLIALFKRRFQPSLKRSAESEANLESKIIKWLDSVENLDDDRIIRRFLEMIKATLRTNYYQRDAKKNEKDYISFKFNPSVISEMPKPLPHFEIFVYSPRVEGVHLRGGKVARGGLRWSDRREDFRTEVLGLVKAQQVKNTVIVPVGAKGGFVCKQLPAISDRDAWLEEGKACYRTFIRGLLDITDNNLHGEIVPPRDVVRHDEDDPYLVVAADKGTATFSDIANQLSDEYQFWMGDAFASGGSNGYDHKGMGITARGGWESVKRHFREIGIDCQTTDFSCVAIGDMAGDVFGNGMLLSKHTCLVAAFNHQHIIIDPKPDSASSYAERRRLFELPRSSWSDYNQELISEGGGIFLRSAKSIPLSKAMQSLLDTDASSLTPNQLIGLILRAKVDLFWNGGIGTYIKASSENNAEVGDRANDVLRINGSELGAKIVGEGGNLGITQLGRVEIAQHGGKINTDFTDNVGGVDCSDNEVNIKILLNSLVTDGELTQKHRNQVLVEMTDDVAKIVLRNAYRQSQSISISQLHQPSNAKEISRFMHHLEQQDELDRSLEFLPNDEELSERSVKGQSLERPEMAVLVAYAKMSLKQHLNVPQVSDNPFYTRILEQSFPRLLQDKYAEKMQHHPLRSEIIATRLANLIVDTVGFNFVTRLNEETGSTPAEICECFVVASEVFEVELTLQKIEALDNVIDAQLQLEMMDSLRRLMRRATRRFLTLRDRSLSIEQQIERYHPSFAALSGGLKKLLVNKDNEAVNKRADCFVGQGVPQGLACQMAQLNSIYSVLDLAEISAEQNQPLSEVAVIYFKLGADIGLHWFLHQINQQSVENHWQALARASFREDLDWQQRQLTQTVIAWDSSLKEQVLVDAWKQEHAQSLTRWSNMLNDFKTSGSHEFAKFSVLLRELNILNLNCSSK
ncbi:NAD-glutamate dehydrogenase [Alginatibacterium sediminis]|uniref:NAD-glutamate dehydrogenase n=1 Tax=Alginatibacterium sediminis TaxID=2164068 RepID=A0A420EHP2_9ALTE|nr:NAD-glutamate dehydrogenase [Alginatibacterium sediminis]RKF20203.1 NAD-glutamate dehydrogenase [Alginatibacterium sediminis]